MSTPVLGEVPTLVVHYGTDRWPHGEFFRYQITALHPITNSVAAHQS